jgi:hypothetical protein
MIFVILNMRFINITHLFPNIDYDKLKDQVSHLEHHVPKAGPGQNAALSGWAVMGINGKHSDGWAVPRNFMHRGTYDPDIAEKIGFFPAHKHKKYTNAASDQFIELLEAAKKLNFNPCRARLIQLMPGRRSSYHTDGPPEILFARMHVVIRTNPDAVFITEEGETHLPENNIFLINVNTKHAVANLGSTARTHLVVDVDDSLNLFGD